MNFVQLQLSYQYEIKEGQHYMLLRCE